jgi:predicted nicotinamide N-methyase
MQGYRMRVLDLEIDGQAYHVHALSDLQQYYDPGHMAEAMGISSAQWSLFGNLWPAGKVLAEAVSKLDVGGRRILELGCGLGLASLVLSHRMADITASDYHPLAGEFLSRNTQANHLPDIRFHALDWSAPDPNLGRFDLVIGSDILYERGHAQLLAGVLERHAAPVCEVLITDPGRGHANRLSRALATAGFEVSETRMRFDTSDVKPFRGRLMRWQRH